MKLALVHGRYINDSVYVLLKEEQNNWLACPFMDNIFDVKNHRYIPRDINKFWQLEEITVAPKYDFIRDFNLKKDWLAQYNEHRYRECLIKLIFNKHVTEFDKLMYLAYFKKIKRGGLYE